MFVERFVSNKDMPNKILLARNLVLFIYLVLFYLLSKYWVQLDVFGLITGYVIL